MESKLRSLGRRLSRVLAETKLRLLQRTLAEAGVRAVRRLMKEDFASVYSDIYRIVGGAPTGVQLYLILHPEVKPKCLECGGKTRWSAEHNRFYEFCSKACAMASPTTKSRRESSMLARYGASNAFASTEIKAKIKATMVSTYGVENPSQDPAIQKKKRDTAIKRHGTTHHMRNAEFVERYQAALRKQYKGKLPMQTKAVKDRLRKTMQSRYGVPHAMQNEEIKQRQQQSTLENNGVDNIFKDTEYIQECYERKLGVNHPMRSKAVRLGMRERSIEKYGVPFPMQHPDVFAKHHQSSKSRKSIQLLGRSHSVRGYEDVVLRSIEQKITYLATDPKVIPRILYRQSGSEHYYFPDALVEMRSGVVRVLEIKSMYTLTRFKSNTQKFKAAVKLCKKLGYEFWVAVLVKDQIIWTKNPTSIRKVVSKCRRLLAT